jgi:hypothetical protein
VHFVRVRVCSRALFVEKFKSHSHQLHKTSSTRNEGPDDGHVNAIASAFKRRTACSMEGTKEKEAGDAQNS